MQKPLKATIFLSFMLHLMRVPKASDDMLQWPLHWFSHYPDQQLRWYFVVLDPSAGNRATHS